MTTRSPPQGSAAATWSVSATTGPSPISSRGGTGESDGWRVVPGEFVEADEGTGIVHLAPAFGEVDRQAGRDHHLPTLNPVGPDGRFTDDVELARGPAGARDEPGDQSIGSNGRGGSSGASSTSTPTPLLAVRDRAHLLGEAELVRPHLRAQGGSGRAERDDRMAPGAHPGRADGGVVGEQRRLGALAGPVLGHPPSGVAVRRGTHSLRRVARGVVRARGPRRHRRGSAPPRHRPR